MATDRHTETRKRLATRHDPAMVERLQARALAEGRTVNDIAEELYKGYLDGAVAVPQAPATAQQLDEVKLALVSLAQAVAEVRQDGIQTRAVLQQALGGIAEGTQRLLDAPPPEVRVALPEPAPVDLSGVEREMAELRGLVKKSLRAPPAPAAVPEAASVVVKEKSGEEDWLAEIEAEVNAMLKEHMAKVNSRR